MRITNLQYDSDRGVVKVEIELPLIGDMTAKETRAFLHKLVDDVMMWKQFEREAGA